MTDALRILPDSLVLGAGGTLGIAWLRGVIAGIEAASGLDLRDCRSFVGTSAGSYVAASLAAGEGAPSDAVVPDAAAEAERETAEHERAADGGAGTVPDGGVGASGGRGADAAGLTAAALRQVVGPGARLAAPLLPVALAATRPPGAAVRRVALALAGSSSSTALDFGRRAAGFGAFDGRLRIVTVDRRRGTRVVFGAPGAPEATVAEAVHASCAVPWIFSPVRIGGREYVDGGVWSLSNLDVAPVGRGAEVLALLPTFRRAGTGGGAGGLGLLRAASQGIGLAEVGVLRARGARVRIVAPDADATRAIGRNPMDASRREAVYAAGRAQGARGAVAGP